MADAGASDTRQATAELAQALRRNPNDAGAWLDLAQLVDDAGRKRDCYERVLALDPGNVEASSGLQQLNAPRAEAGVDSAEAQPQATRPDSRAIEAGHVPEPARPAAPAPRPYSPDLSLLLVLAVFGCLIVVVPLAITAYSRLPELGLSVPQPSIELPTVQPIPNLALTPGFSSLFAERPSLAEAGKNGYDWRKASFSQKTAFCEWMVNDSFFTLGIEATELRQRLDRYYSSGKRSSLETEVTSAAVSVSLFDGFD